MFFGLKTINRPEQKLTEADAGAKKKTNLLCLCSKQSETRQCLLRPARVRQPRGETRSGAGAVLRDDQEEHAVQKQSETGRTPGSAWSRQ